MQTRLLLVSVLICLVQGCATVPVETPKAIATQDIPTQDIPTSTPQLTPLEWIQTRPFLEVPPDQPDLVLSGLPDGFEPQDPQHEVGTLPSGLELQMTHIEYQLAIDNQVQAENNVTVELFAYQDAEARIEHLTLIAGEGYSWEFQQVEENKVVRYYTTGVDGRIWISGPYMIVVRSGLNTSDSTWYCLPMNDSVNGKQQNL